MAGTVSLGLPGPWVVESDPIDAFANRVGGMPSIPPGGKHQESHLAPTCRVCTSVLSLLAQVHAPLTAKQVGRNIPQRFLYLFGCTKGGCGAETGAWRALRFQCDAVAAGKGPQPAAVQSTAPVGATASSNHPATAAGTASVTSASAAFGGGWGSAGDWATAPQTGLGTSAAQRDPLSFDDLDTALSDAFSKSATISPASNSAEQHDSSSGNASGSDQQSARHSMCPAAEAVAVSAGQPLPGFYLHWQDEPEAASGQLAAAEAQHIVSLVEQYQLENDAADMETEGWSGEAYEKDVLPGGDDAFPKFSKRLWREPEQCLRYSLGGELLWPKAQQPQPAPCAACGSTRHLEMQAMPAVHQALTEGLAWARHQDASKGAVGSGARAAPSIDGWSWLSAAVFTCSQSCSVGGEKEHTLLEEEVHIVNE